MQDKTKLKTWQCRTPEGTWVPCDFDQIEDGDTVRIFEAGVPVTGVEGETDFLVTTKPRLTGNWVSQ